MICKIIGKKRRKMVLGRLRIKVLLIQESFQGLMVDCSHSREKQTGRQLGDVHDSVLILILTLVRSKRVGQRQT